MRKQHVYLDFCTEQIVYYCSLVKQFDGLLAIIALKCLLLVI